MAGLGLLRRLLRPIRNDGRVVFLGDSITEAWPAGDPRWFRDRICAGVGGETCAEMLARFDTDVVARRAEIVHIMGGTNDLWRGSPGPMGRDTIDRIAAMLAKADAARIAVVLAPPPPISAAAAADFAHADLFVPLTRGIERLARTARNVTFVNYGPLLSDGTGHLRKGYTTDGIHLTPKAYRAMRRPAAAAIDRAARSRSDR